MGGVCFTVDEWMRRLFHPERPSDAGYEWYAPRIERCTDLIWSPPTELVRVGTPSVLEIGLAQRAARAGFYERARAAQLRVEVMRDMFDFVEQMWEPPSESELLEHDGERVDTSTPLPDR